MNSGMGQLKPEVRIKELFDENLKLKERIEELESENADLKDRLSTWEPKPLPPKGERGFETPTKKGKRK